MVEIELVYAPAEGPLLQRYFSLKSGSTVADALEASGVFTSHPETKDLAVGIFSKQVPLHSLVKSGDRIEIYRPLIIDPMEKRRQRAKGKKAAVTR